MQTSSNLVSTSVVLTMMCGNAVDQILLGRCLDEVLICCLLLIPLCFIFCYQPQQGFLLLLFLLFYQSPFYVELEHSPSSVAHTKVPQTQNMQSF